MFNITIAPWIMALVCLMGIVVLLFKWRVDKRFDTLVRIPSLLWLGFVYLAVWQDWFGLADPMMRTSAVRWPILMLLLTLTIVDLLGVRIITYTRRMFNDVHA